MASKTIESGLDKIKKNQAQIFLRFVSRIGKKTPWIFGFQDITKQNWIFFFQKNISERSKNSPLQNRSKNPLVKSTFVSYTVIEKDDLSD